MIFVVVLAALAIAVAVSAIKVVPEGYEYTVEQMGRYVRTLRPGLVIVLPVVETISRRVDMMERLVEIPRQTAVTRDRQGLAVDAVMTVRVFDAHLASYAVADPWDAILHMAESQLRAVVGARSLEEALSRRMELGEQVREAMRAGAARWGLRVSRVDLKDLVPTTV